MRSYLRLLLIPLSLVALSGGCGASKQEYPSTKLEGTITVDGVPLVNGTITLTPTQKGQGNGVEASVVDGKYLFEKAPLGSVIVSFHATKETGRTYLSEQAGKELAETISLIPSRYELGIPLTITNGMAIQDFPLEMRQRFDARRIRPAQ